MKAVYNNSRIITAIFGFLWLSIGSLSFLLMLGITGCESGLPIVIMSYANFLTDRIPYTRRCIEGVVNTTFTTIPIILTAAFDTLVFLAISYHMVSISMGGNSWSARVRSFFTGDGLHHLSRSLLQGGQAYYLLVHPLDLEKNQFGLTWTQVPL